jgi:regulator of sirC expression with transglutaminase-like and TPR domain
MDLDRTLALLAIDPEHPIDVAEVALHLARDEYPDLDVPSYLARLEGYADAIAPRLVGSLAERTVVFTHFLFDEEGFRGNELDYYNPHNSYFSDVLDRRLGLPITLSVLAAAVGERAGLTVQGVGLPGHFVAKAVEGDEMVLFDPFHGGRILSLKAAEELVSPLIGQSFSMSAVDLIPAPPAAIVTRMLSNLKGVYLKLADFRRAARIIGRLLQLTPHDPLQHRDLGVTLIQNGEPGRALDHLQFYLDHAPASEDAETVRDVLKRARGEVAKWN